jgi:hypothetical protein
MYAVTLASGHLLIICASSRTRVFEISTGSSHNAACGSTCGDLWWKRKGLEMEKQRYKKATAVKAIARDRWRLERWRKSMTISLLISTFRDGIASCVLWSGSFSIIYCDVMKNVEESWTKFEVHIIRFESSCLGESAWFCLVMQGSFGCLR